MKKVVSILAGVLACAFVARASDIWTLERSLDYAVTHNPDARIARQRIAAAQAGLEQAEAAFWPKLQIQSSYTRTDNPALAFGNVLNQRSYRPSLDLDNVPGVDNLNARGVITVPLYAGGQNAAGRQSAQANSDAARHESAAVRNALGFAVSRAFHTVRKTRQFIRAADAAVISLETNLTIAGRRLDAGTLLKSEVLDVEVRLAQTREDSVRARNGHDLAVRALCNLLGVEDGAIAVDDTAPVVSVPQSGDFSHRAELAAASDRERAAKAQLRGARGGYQPQISAFGSLDHNHGWVTGGHGDSYSTGVMMQWDLWDGFATRAKVREAGANLESSREEHRKLRLALALEVERAQLALKAAGERLVVSNKSVEHAAQSASLTRHRFEQGLALSSQLIDSETALLTTRVRRAEAEFDQHIAVAALRKALALPQLDSKPTAK